MISNYPVRKQTNKQKNWIKYTHTHKNYSHPRAGRRMMTARPARATKWEHVTKRKKQFSSKSHFPDYHIQWENPSIIQSKLKKEERLTFRETNLWSRTTERLTLHWKRALRNLCAPYNIGYWAVLKKHHAESKDKLVRFGVPWRRPLVLMS